MSVLRRTLDRQPPISGRPSRLRRSTACRGWILLSVAATILTACSKDNPAKPLTYALSGASRMPTACASTSTRGLRSRADRAHLGSADPSRGLLSVPVGRNGRGLEPSPAGSVLDPVQGGNGLPRQAGGQELGFPLPKDKNRVSSRV